MRFLLREQPFERLVSSGTFLYSQHNQPTGAVEHWRLTNAIDGYQFLRVDLDARAALSGRSHLYHLLLNPAGKPEQLKFRFWATGWDVAGILLFDRTGLTLSRTINGEKIEDIGEAKQPFWFPATSGLWLLNQTEQPEPTTAYTLQIPTFQLTEWLLTLANNPPMLRATWANQSRTLWFNQHGFIEKMVRQDDLTATLTRYIHYF